MNLLVVHPSSRTKVGNQIIPPAAQKFQLESFEMKSIYVGNLPFSALEDDVRDMFSTHGEVASVKLIEDRETGRFRGFGFVEMDDADAESAIEALDGKDMGGRALKVNEAKPRAPRPRY